MTPTQLSSTYLSQTMADVLTTEATAVRSYARTADPALVDAVRLIHAHDGPLVVAGVGKSGHVGRKIASTFCSLGKPAVFLHAAEASHGDLGLITDRSAVLCLSNSGETSELSDLLHYCRTHALPMIAITSRADSTLAQFAEVAIIYGQTQEACINGLAPTTSTTLTLAIGDALAVGLSAIMGIAPEDFRRFHPGGKLGARLMTARQLMKSNTQLPLVSSDTPMNEAVIVMSEKALGTALVVDRGELRGIITDGDLRRHSDRLWEHTAGEIATADPIRVDPDMLASDAAELMSAKGISCCVVESPAGVLEGLLCLHDCISGSN